MGVTFALTASASPFRPIMTEPKNYVDFQYGIEETRTNVSSVQCGGWTPAELDRKKDCSVVFTCKDGINTCGETTGQTGLKQSDGSIPICLSNSDAQGGVWDYLLIHELTHAKQVCALAPGEPLEDSKAACCAAETEAYTVQCQAEADDGRFAGLTPPIDVQSCVNYGINKVSCASWGPNACFKSNCE